MGGTIEVTLIKSMVGRPAKHRKILKGMGLNKINKTVALKNTAAARGMVNAVSHMVRVEERNNETE